MTIIKIEQVGTISASNDPEIGKLIAEAMAKVSKDGVITVEEAKEQTLMWMWWKVCSSITAVTCRLTS